MNASTAQLTEIKFTERRKGYDPDEVDNFLERVGERVFQLQERVREANRRAEEAEARASAADERVAAARERVLSAERRVEELTAELASAAASAPAASPPEPEAAPEPVAISPKAAELEETLTMLALAQRTAEAAIKEANERAEQVVRDAEVEARRRAESTAAPLRTELVRLEETKRQLLREVAALEEHVNDQRSRIRHSIDELRAALDRPGALRVTPPPVSGPDGAADDAPDDAADDAVEPTATAGADDEVSTTAGSDTAVSELTGSDEASESAPASDSAPLPEPEPSASLPPRPTSADSGREPAFKPRSAAPGVLDGAPAEDPAPTRPVDVVELQSLEHRPVEPAAAEPQAPDQPHVEPSSAEQQSLEAGFLDELRKAVHADDEPAGVEADVAMQAFFDGGGEDTTRRFGRRR